MIMDDDARKAYEYIVACSSARPVLAFRPKPCRLIEVLSLGIYHGDEMALQYFINTKAIVSEDLQYIGEVPGTSPRYTFPTWRLRYALHLSAQMMQSVQKQVLAWAARSRS